MSGIRSGPMLTVLVVTRNRAAFLNRLLAYMATMRLAARVIVADSSSAEQFSMTAKVIASLEDGSEIAHLPYPEDWRNFRVLADVLQTVKTPYVAWNSDDDFLIGSALEPAIRFLEEHDDYAVVHGKAVAFRVAGDAARGRVLAVVHYRQGAVEQATASARLVAHLGAYTTTAYSVHRTPQLAESYARAVEGELDGPFGELLASCLPIVHGKARKLDELYMARQLHGGMTSARTGGDTFDWVARSEWSAQWRFFQTCIAEALGRQEGRGIDNAREVIKQAFWAYLARSFAGKYAARYGGRRPLGRVRATVRRVPGLRRSAAAVRSWIALAGSDRSPGRLFRAGPHAHLDFRNVVEAIED